MDSYYDAAAHIRYYGQLPRTVRREWESVLDGAGKRVKREVVAGEMDFTEGNLSVVEMDGVPEGLIAEVCATPSEKPMDLGRRRGPVHKVLANLVLDAGSLYAFSRLWGYLGGEVDSKRSTFRTHSEHIQPYQDILRRAWRGDGKAVRQLAEDISARVDVTPNGIDIAVLDLWNLIRLLFLRDHAAGRTKVCANQGCLSPYFLQQRKGQKFCSHECAVLINVRRFRARLGKSKFPPKGQGTIHSHGDK